MRLQGREARATVARIAFQPLLRTGERCIDGPLRVRRLFFCCGFALLLRFSAYVYTFLILYFGIEDSI